MKPQTYLYIFFFLLLFSFASFAQTKQPSDVNAEVDETPYYAPDQRGSENQEAVSKKKDDSLKKQSRKKGKKKRANEFVDKKDSLVNQQVNSIPKIEGPKVDKLKEINEAETGLKLPDSIQTKYQESIKAMSHLNELSKDNPDSLKKEAGEKAKNKAISEGKRLGNQEATKHKEFQEAQKYSSELEALRQDSINVDKVAEGVLKKTDLGKEFEGLNGENSLSEMQAKMEEMQKQAEELNQQELLKQQVREKASKVATQDLAQFAPQIQQAQKEFTKYKRKMEWIKEGSGENANSLKGEPFKKRLIYGANFQITQIDPFTFYVAPYLGYRLNKKFSSGTGLTYKLTLGKNSFNNFSPEGREFGYRIFTDYKLVKGWFGHAEFEQLNKMVKPTNQENYQQQWQTNAYIGVGRQIRAVKNLKINVYLLCNLLHPDLNRFSPEAFQMRFGMGN